MTQINSFAGSMVQSTTVQRQQSDDKDRQVRRAAELAKNSSLQGDQLEHQVESTEELAAIHDEERGKQRKRRSAKHKNTEADDSPVEQPPRLDLTA